MLDVKVIVKCMLEYKMHVRIKALIKIKIMLSILPNLKNEC